MLVIVVHSFCCCSSFILFFIFVVVLHFFASTSSLTLPWKIAGFLHPFFTFSPAHRRVICSTFIFNLSEIFFHSFTASATVLGGHFHPQAFFTLRSFTYLLPAFVKSSLGAGSSSLGCAELHTDPRNTDPAHLLFLFTVIHNLHIQNDSFLNSTIYS